MAQHDRQHGKRAQPVYVRTIVSRRTLIASLGERIAGRLAVSRRYCGAGINFPHVCCPVAAMQ